jgi:hypothetical protein
MAVRRRRARARKPARARRRTRPTGAATSPSAPSPGCATTDDSEDPSRADHRSGAHSAEAHGKRGRSHTQATQASPPNSATRSERTDRGSDGCLSANASMGGWMQKGCVVSWMQDTSFSAATRTSHDGTSDLQRAASETRSAFHAWTWSLRATHVTRRGSALCSPVA